MIFTLLPKPISKALKVKINLILLSVACFSLACFLMLTHQPNIVHYFSTTSATAELRLTTQQPDVVHYFFTSPTGDHQQLLLVSNDDHMSTTTSKPLPSVTFWTSDLHEGSRIDTPSLLQFLGQRVIVNGHKGYSSPYPEVQRRFIIPEKRSDFINSYIYHTQHIFEWDIEDNFNYYANDPLLAGTDAFICSFPASYCELWMPFNKSIVFLPVHRFFLGRCTNERMERLIQHVIAMNSSTSPKHFIAAGGVYDAEYINYFTGLKPIVLSSNSFFYAGRGASNYTQSRKEILVGPLHLRKLTDEEAEELAAASEKRSVKEKWTFITAKSLYCTYELQNISDHRAVVLFPYAVLSYGITELYAMGIPMLVPTINMIIKYGWVRDRAMIDPFICDTADVPPKHPSSPHPFSPETYEPKALAYWLKYADFYQWPHITYFDSFDDLIDKLETMDFENVHQKMAEANKQREKELIERWGEIIRQIEPGRQVPTNYRQAIKDLWNVDSLQVN